MTETTMIALSNEDAAQFEHFQATELALQTTIAAHTKAMNAAHLDLITASRKHWTAVLAKHGLAGNWHYAGGNLVPAPMPVSPMEELARQASTKRHADS